MNARAFWQQEASAIKEAKDILDTSHLDKAQSSNNNTVGRFIVSSKFNDQNDLLRIVRETEMYKEFMQFLIKQTVYDIYLFAFDSKSTINGNIVSNVNFDKDGYDEGEGAKGKTILIDSPTDLILKTGNASDPEEKFILSFIDKNDLKNSFDEKKKLILVGIASQLLLPQYYLIHQDKKAFETIRDASDKTLYFKWWDTAKLCAAQTTIHELIAHSLNYLKKNKLESEEEHRLYHGEYSIYSPTVKNVLAVPNKYKNTTMMKVIQDIQRIIKLFYQRK